MDVACVGILVVDCMGRPVRKLPQWGRLELVDSIELHTGGCATNTGFDLANLGVSVGLVGRIGHDGLGDFLLKEAARHHCDTTLVVRDPQAGTSATLVMIDEAGERTFLHAIGANGRLSLGDVHLPELKRRGVKIVHVGGALVLPGLDGEPMAQLFRQAKQLGITTSLDTVWDSTGRWMSLLAPVLPYTDVFLPSYHEAQQLTGESDPGRIASALLARGVGSIAVKLGDQGSFVKTRSQELQVPAYKVTAVDGTGAGDAYVAGFLTGLLQGWPLERTARLANATGALAVTAIGATTGVTSLADALKLMGEPER